MKVGDMSIGKLVYDYALGMTGIVVSGAWIEDGTDTGTGIINWEWNVLYEDGELQGADTGDLQECS